MKKIEAFSLLESIVSLSILLIIILGTSRLLLAKKNATQMFIQAGENTDLRNYFYGKISCSQTLLNEKTACDTGGAIKSYDTAGNAIIADKSVGKKFEDISVTLHCSNDGISYLIEGKIYRLKVAGSKKLFTIPFTCRLP